MRKIYVFLFACVLFAANQQKTIQALEQEIHGNEKTVSDFTETPETNEKFHIILELVPNEELIAKKTQAADEAEPLISADSASATEQNKDMQLQDDISATQTEMQTAEAAVQLQNDTETAQETQNEDNAIAEDQLTNQPAEQEQVQAEQQARPKKRQKKLLKHKKETQTEEAAEQPDAEPTAQTEPEDNIEPVPVRRQIGIDIPYDNALVQKFINQYTTDYAKKWLVAVMKNGAPYRSYIRAKLAEMGLPECLEFLPVIESNFKIDAVSKSGAMGMWQFMKNSISPFGIRINEWMDERCDPWLTTDAALKKLKENYDVLGDWNLALAAYNSGLGAVSRACKKNAGDDYWNLCAKKQLKNESINYVPKFLAIADILTNPEYYGIETVEFDETAHLNYEILEVKRNVDISLIAEQTEIDSETIKFLNPALFYGVTPPDTTYRLRIPLGSKDAVSELINDKNKLLIKYHLYKVRSGDTVYALSRHYGVSEDMIKQANPGLKPSQLKIGQTLRIPAFKDVAPYAGKSANKNIAYTGSYVVQQGDSLWSISLKYDVQVESLAEANNMKVDAILRIGSTLKVPIIQ